MDNLLFCELLDTNGTKQLINIASIVAINIYDWEGFEQSKYATIQLWVIKWDKDRTNPYSIIIPINQYNLLHSHLSNIIIKLF